MTTQTEADNWHAKWCQAQAEIERLNGFLTPGGKQEYLLLEQRDNLKAALTEKDAEIETWKRNWEALANDVTDAEFKLKAQSAQTVAMRSLLEEARGYLSSDYNYPIAAKAAIEQALSLTQSDVEKRLQAMERVVEAARDLLSQPLLVTEENVDGVYNSRSRLRGDLKALDSNSPKG